jgi:Protein of unknown function (DUF3644)
MMATKRIGKNQRPYFQKARDSALLAVEVYNKPAVKFKSEGYVALMVMAWTALMHAIFLRKGRNPYYKANGQYLKVDGDFKHWELAECAKRFWGNDTANPVRKNLEFFIPLRNKIEHRHVPELDGAIFGECQALLLNFDTMLGQHFGAKHQLRESLSFSLQLFPSGESFAQAVKANKRLADLKKFIEDYRATLTADTMASGQYAFKAFLIQVANHDSAETLPIQFVQFDKLTDQQKAEFEKFAVMVKWKAAGVANAGLLKPGAVVKMVQAALGNPKVVRPTGTVDKFNHATHERCWKRYGVRPPNGSKTPAATQEKFCIYDEPHKDYLYTPAWIEHLIGKMQIDGEYESLYKKP